MPVSLESQKSSNMLRMRAGTASSSQPRNASSSRRLRCAYRAGAGWPSPRDAGSLFAQLFVSAMTRHLPVADAVRRRAWRSA